MAIERQSGQITLICDECSDDLGWMFDPDEFGAMIEYAKAEGWSIKPDDDGEWTHLCPDCGGGGLSRIERARRVLGR